MNTEPHPTDRASLERDSDITFFVAGGPGGQNRNKVATGVRLLHRPSGMAVTATRLAARLEDAQREETPRVATRPSRAAKAERRDEKRRRSVVKQGRRRIQEE
jgi:protein subunit release factor B